MAAAFGALVASAPAWLLLAGAVDLATAGRRLPRTRALLFFGAYLALELAGVTAAAGLFVAHRGGRARGQADYLAANAALQRWWTSALWRCARGVFGLRLALDPASDPVQAGPLLLWVRHTSTADTILAAVLVANPHAILLRYVLKRELLWDPCLDVVGRRLPNTFVDRTGSRREAEIRAVAALGADLGATDGALIYPEGTRFSPAKLEAARARLAAEGRGELAAIAASYRFMLPPRLGGPLALLEAAPGVDVVVLEHEGFEAAQSLGALWRGALVGRTIHARLRRIQAADIPEAGRDRWLFEEWRETDAWVAARKAERGAAR